MTGVGRGRGWLNLKSGNPPSGSPGSQGSKSPTTNASLSPNSCNSSNGQFSDAIQDYIGLVNKIKQLNLSDDGIKFNQKIKYIVENWSEDCKNAQQVAESFDIIHEACLVDSDLATKLVLLIASRTFLNQTIHENNIRLMFLRKLQDNFESCVQMQRENPNAFRNSVQMMGEFYSKARMANGQQFSFMATALCSYLEMLIESSEPIDLKLFARQLYLNGTSLKAESPEQISDILNKVRLLLCPDKNLTQDSKLWLLLTLEAASNRFALLPPDTHQFYHDHLGENNMASFQGIPTVLSVQTIQGSKKLDNYQSNVNVLQVSDSLNESNISSPSNSTVPDINSCINNSSGFQSDPSDHSHINIIVKDIRSKLNNTKQPNQTQPSIQQNHQKSSKPSTQPSQSTGRPILGVGARLQRNRVNTDSSATTNDNLTSSFENSWRDSKEMVSKERGQMDNNRHNNKDGNWRSHGKQNQVKKSGGDWGDKNQRKSSAEGEWDNKKKNSPPKQSGKGWQHDDRFENDYS